MIFIYILFRLAGLYILSRVVISIDRRLTIKISIVTIKYKKDNKIIIRASLLIYNRYFGTSSELRIEVLRITVPSTNARAKSSN